MRKILIACFVLLGMLSLSTSLLLGGCPKEKDPAEELLQSYAKHPPSASDNSVPPSSLPPDQPSQTAGQLAAAEQRQESKVDLQLFEVHPPYPGFDAKGNYSVDFSVESLEPTGYAVWAFVAYDKDDNEVGRIVQGLEIPYKNKKNLKFDKKYFLAKPVRFDAVLTDKQAVRADEATSSSLDNPPANSAPPTNDASSGGVTTSKKEPYNLYYGRMKARPCGGNANMEVQGAIEYLEVPSGAHLTLAFDGKEQAQDFDPSGSDEQRNCYYFPVEPETDQQDIDRGVTFTKHGMPAMVQKLETSGNQVEISCPGATGLVVIKSPFPGGKTPMGFPCPLYYCVKFI